MTSWYMVQTWVLSLFLRIFYNWIYFCSNDLNYYWVVFFLQKKWCFWETYFGLFSMQKQLKLHPAFPYCCTYMRCFGRNALLLVFGSKHCFLVAEFSSVVVATWLQSKYLPDIRKKYRAYFENILSGNMIDVDPKVMR